MGVANPDIFSITGRARSRYSAASEGALDAEVGMQDSAKVLHYILHLILSDHHPHTANLPIDDATHRARLNFSRLLRQVDVNDLLPETPLGLIRLIHPLGPFPMPEAVRLQWPRLHSQRQSLEAVLRAHHTAYTNQPSARTRLYPGPPSVLSSHLSHPPSPTPLSRIFEFDRPFLQHDRRRPSGRSALSRCRSGMVLSQCTYCRIYLPSQSLGRTPCGDFRLFSREFVEWRCPRPDRWARALRIRRWPCLCPCT